MVDLLERLEVLLVQEKVSYRTKDYLAPSFQQSLVADFADEEEPLSSSSLSTSSGINEVWREKICEWSYQVVDHFDFSREVVTVSIHYLDRYLSTRAVNKKLFQLAAMTSLYLAVKLYEPATLSMKCMIELSRGYFLVEEMAEMECAILRALAWKVHPPTANCFSKHIMFLLPYSSVSLDIRYDILELARFLTELSVIDYYFVWHRPSSVSLAAIMTAMELIPGASESATRSLKHELRRVHGLDPQDQGVHECSDRLRVLYCQGGYSRPEPVEQHTRLESISPVCVSQVTNPLSTFPNSQITSSDPKSQSFTFLEANRNESQYQFECMQSMDES